MDKPTLLAAMGDAHEALELAADGLANDELLEDATGLDGWTRKDVLAHVEWWSDHSTRVIDALRAGREPYDRSGPWDIDAHNAEVLETNRGRSAADVRRAEADAYRRLVTAVDAASDAELFEEGRFAWLEGEPLWRTVDSDSSAHYREHLAHLAAAGG